MRYTAPTAKELVSLAIHHLLSVSLEAAVIQFSSPKHNEIKNDVTE